MTRDEFILWCEGKDILITEIGKEAFRVRVRMPELNFETGTYSGLVKKIEAYLYPQAVLDTDRRCHSCKLWSHVSAGYGRCGIRGDRDGISISCDDYAERT